MHHEARITITPPTRGRGSTFLLLDPAHRTLPSVGGGFINQCSGNRCNYGDYMSVGLLYRSFLVPLSLSIPSFRKIYSQHSNPAAVS